MLRSDSNPTILFLGALIAFGPISTDLYLPALPSLVGAFATDVATVQLTLSVFVAGFAVGQLIYGPLSDRFGRRVALLIGMGVFFLASVGCAFAASMEALIAGRFVQALGASAGPVLARAIVRDLFERDRAARAMALMSSAMALVPLVAPLIGGQLQVLFGWRASFAAMAAFGGIMLLIGVFGVQETNRHRDPLAMRPRRLLTNFRAILTNGGFLGYAAVVGLTYASLFAFISGSSFVLIGVYGIAPERFGFAFSAVVCGYLSGSLSAGKLAGRWGVERLVAFGTVATTLAGGLLAGLAWAGVDHLAAVILPMSCVFFAIGLVIPAGTAAAVAPFTTMAGASSSLLGFVQLSCGAIAGLAVGQWHDGTARPMASIVFLAGALGCAVYFAVLRGRRNRTTIG